MGYGYFATSVRADADGNYRISTLPPSSYQVWADTPEWVAPTAKDIAAAPGKTYPVP